MTTNKTMTQIRKMATEHNKQMSKARKEGNGAEIARLALEWERKMREAWGD